MDFDRILKNIGEFGRQQKQQFVVVSTICSFWGPPHMLCLAFAGITPDFHCRGQGNIADDDVCARDCQRYIYNKEITSIATEWDLVCSESYKVGLAQSMYMLGVLCGSYVFSFISDTYGRRKAFYLSTCFLTLFALSSALATSYQMFVALRFFTAMCNGGVGLTGFILATETIGPKYRALAGTLVQVQFALGIVVYGILAYFVRDWRYLIGLSTAPGLVFLMSYWIVPESPRWLITKGRTQEAEDILHYIAIKNGAKTKLGLVHVEDHNKKPNQPPGKIYGFLDLFKSSEIRKRMLIMIYTWFTCSMVYYGLTMNASQLGGNRYLNFMLSGIVELPAYFVCMLFIDRSGRRKTLFWSMILGGSACLLLLVIPDSLDYSSSFKTMFALIGKMGISLAFNVIYIYAAELIPTVLRNTGLGVCAMSARVGGIAAPAVVPFGETLAFLIFGGTGFTAGILDFFLPESLNKALPETLDDLKETLTKSEEQVEKITQKQLKKLEKQIGDIKDDNLDDETTTML